LNYNEFFHDVSVWINVCNQKSLELGGVKSTHFWVWVADSLGRLCEKYDNHALVQAQVKMLWDWLQK